MKALKALLPLLLVLALCLSACGSSAAPAASGSDLKSATAAPTEAPAATPAPTPAPTPEPTPEPAPALDTDMEVRVMVMNGATGFGMAKLITDAAAGAAALNYAVSVESDASNVTAALISGSVDIAVLPTNAASVVYNKTSGGIRVAAEVVRGNLYLLQNTESEAVTSFEDLRGKTVYAPAQNPTFIFTLLCKANGLVPGEDIVIDNAYAQPADLRTALAAGEADLAVLPEPMVTIAMSSNDKVGVALDLREAWRDAVGSDSLVMGCVTVRTAFAEEHPAELAAFLEDYAASVSFIGDSANAEAAGALIEQAGVFAQAKVAQKALPRCSLCFVTGEEMREEISAYLAQLCALNPAAVGGAEPGDDFYYIP